MGNFRNTTLGTGLLSIGGIDAGFLKGNVQVQRTVEQAIFESGVPLQPQGRVITKETIQLTAPIGEITAENMSAVSGTIPVTTNAGTPATAPAFGATSEHTFRTPVLGGLQTIELLGPSVTSFLMKDVTEVTDYTNEDDFLLDAARGIVYRNPAGDIAAGETVRTSYGYTIPASKQLDLGKYFVFNETSVTFTHVSPVSGKTWTVHFWRAQGSAELDLNFEETNYTVMNVTFISLPDPSRPNNPNGYIRRTEA